MSTEARDLWARAERALKTAAQWAGGVFPAVTRSSSCAGSWERC